MHPHGEPSDKKIEKGDFVTIDMGAVVEGYCGDMTRTFAMGSVTAKMAEIYDVVLSAQTAALNACRAGVRCFDIDKIARDIINQAGYGEYYIHGTGHGVGKDVHEAPTLNSKSDYRLQVLEFLFAPCRSGSSGMYALQISFDYQKGSCH